MILVFPKQTVFAERLRNELAAALDIPTPYVDSYEDRLEIVGMVEESMRSSITQILSVHIPEPYPEPVDKVAKALNEVATMVLKDKIKDNVLDNDTASKVCSLFPELDLSGTAVSVGDVYSWDETLVEVIQAHTTQPSWAPDITPALFKVYRNAAAGPSAWVQPLGGHDSYSAGEQVSHNSFVWANTHGNGNVWEPGVYGWTKVT